MYNYNTCAAYTLYACAKYAPRVCTSVPFILMVIFTLMLADVEIESENWNFLVE